MAALLAGPNGGEPPRRRGPSGASGGRPSGEAQAPALDEPSFNPFSALKAAGGSGGSVGSGFVWVLLLLTALMLAFSWLRFRRRDAHN